MRVVNRHSARVDDLEPGHEGDVDESRSGVQVLLRAGLLEAVLDAPEAAAVIEASPAIEPMPEGVGPFDIEPAPVDVDAIAAEVVAVVEPAVEPLAETLPPPAPVVVEPSRRNRRNG